MALKRMDNIGIVVESLDTAVSFFSELGMKLEGRTMIEGEWAGRVTGLGDQIRGPEWLLIGLAEQLGSATDRVGAE